MKSLREEIARRIVENMKQQDEFTDRKGILNEAAMEKHGLTKWVPAEGDNFIQMLPLPEIDEETTVFRKQVVRLTTLAFPLWVHWRVGPEGHSFLCLRKMYGKPCPVCEEFNRLRARNEPWEVLKEFSIPTKPNRWFFYIVDVSDPSKIEETGPQVFLCPVTVKDEIYGRMLEKSRTGEILGVKFLPTDPAEARIFKFHRSGTDRGTTYTECEYCDPTTAEGKPEDISHLAEGLPPLEEILYMPTYEEVKEALSLDSSVAGSKEAETKSSDEVEEVGENEDDFAQSLEEQVDRVFGGEDEEEEVDEAEAPQEHYRVVRGRVRTKRVR